MNKLFAAGTNFLRLNTLVGRISSIFFILALLLAGLQYLLISILWNLAEQESRQRLEWHLGEDLAAKVQSTINANSATMFEQVQLQLQEFEAINPRISISVLDSEGKLIPEFYRTAYYPIESQRGISAEVLREAAAEGLNRSFPLYAPSIEMSGNSVSTVFSLGKLRYRNQDAYLYVELDNSAYRSLINGLEAKYIFVGGSLTSLALLLGLSAIGYFGISGIANRFRAFTEGVNKIAGGTYTTRVPSGDRDEVAVLGKQINHMAECIESSIKRLEDNDRWRREMTASLSHDLKTPLSAMLAHNEQLIRSFSPERDAEILTRLSIFERNLHTLHKYVEDILELSRLESSQFKIEVGPFHIAEIIEDELIPRLQPLADEHGLTLVAKISPEAKLVYFDVTLFERILENLISNALKYSQGTTVEINFEMAAEHGWVSVQDDGCGIPQDALEKLLKPFTRGDSARTTANPGSGLGLAIVALILKAHGSALECTSKVGGGTRFRFKVAQTDQAAQSMLAAVEQETRFLGVL